MENESKLIAAIRAIEAEEMISLTEKIIERHSLKGPASPLNVGQVAEINYKVKRARDKHAEGLKYKRLMEEAWSERDNFLKTDSNGLTETVIHLIRVLTESYAEDRTELAQWGFREEI